jgi:hypothetical protein
MPSLPPCQDTSPERSDAATTASTQIASFASCNAKYPAVCFMSSSTQKKRSSVVQIRATALAIQLPPVTEALQQMTMRSDHDPMPMYLTTEALQPMTMRSDHDPILMHRITEALQQMTMRSHSGHLKDRAICPHLRKDLCRSSPI